MKKGQILGAQDASKSYRPMKETSQKTLARAERKRDRKDGIEGGQHTEERKKSKREKVDGRDTEKQ